MRVGHNPHKNKLQSATEYFHQVIIPVYIPNQEGYFKDSFKIFQLCIESLLQTSHKKTYIAIVNNGSCIMVVDYLNELYQQNKIQELIHTSGIGKLNAILKGLSGNNFPLITISDADVLFLNNWQKATYVVFDNFHKTGSVCPTPSSRSLRTYTANIYWDLFFSNKLKFTNVANREALQMFGHSVGDINFYNKTQLEKYLTVSNGNVKAVVGAGHFITTYRTEVFSDLRNRYTNYKLGGDSESKFLDIPVVKNGFWRLSTTDNYAYHMGNVIEDWMVDRVATLEQEHRKIDFKLKFNSTSSKWSYFFKTKLFGKIILNKKIIFYYLVLKGLTFREAKEYLIIKNN